MGWIAGWDEALGLLVDFEGNVRGPLPARSTVPLEPETLQQAVRTRQGAVLLFERGDPALPLVVGLVQPASSTPMLDIMLNGPSAPVVEAEVDDRRLVLEGKDEVVLRCGEASITLRRNGKVVISGTYVVSRARGTNRIKGGSVQIN